MFLFYSSASIPFSTASHHPFHIQSHSSFSVRFQPDCAVCCFRSFVRCAVPLSIGFRPSVSSFCSLHHYTKRPCTGLSDRRRRRYTCHAHSRVPLRAAPLCCEYLAQISPGLTVCERGEAEAQMNDDRTNGGGNTNAMPRHQLACYRAAANE